MTQFACPPRSQLEAYAIGGLTDEDSDMLFDHITGCGECQQELSSFDDSGDVGGSDPGASAFGSDSAQIEGSFAAEPSSGRLRDAPVDAGSNNAKTGVHRTARAAKSKLDRRSEVATGPPNLSHMKLPTFGGFFKDGFHAGMLDGSVIWFEGQLNDVIMMKQLLTRDGGEPVRF